VSSLLARFYGRIKGSQEDIVSEGIKYILNNSYKTRSALNLLLENKTGQKLSDLRFISQKVEEKRERPDIVGVDENGEEKLIIEAKFWATLTENQPNEYLKDLAENGILLFIVPSKRTRIIFNEVLRKMGEEFNISSVDMDNEKITIKDKEKYVLIKGWDEIFSLLKQALIEEKNLELVSDIDQLIGFYEFVEKKSFKPISSEDLSPEIPQKINSYYDLVDKVVDELIKRRSNEISNQGLARAPQIYGYHRYLRTEEIYGCAMCLKFDLWAENFDTPFWFYISKVENTQWSDLSEKDKRILKKYLLLNKLSYVEKDKGMYLPLVTPLNKPEKEVINNFVEQIEDILKFLEENK